MKDRKIRGRPNKNPMKNAILKVFEVPRSMHRIPERKSAIASDVAEAITLENRSPGKYFT